MAQLKEKRTWQLYRQCAMDVCGEYYPSGGYEGTKVLVEPTRLPVSWLNPGGGNFPYTQVTLDVRVSGRERGAVYKVERWSATVCMGEHREHVISGRASSVAEVYRIIDSLIFDSAVYDVMRSFYSKQLARCIYKLDDEGNWQPFATGFYHTGASSWPVGTYLEVQPLRRDWHDGLFAWKTKHEGGCTISSGVRPSPMPGWL